MATDRIDEREPRRPAAPEDEPAPAGPLAEALERVGDRWTLLIVAALLDGPLRFGDLQEAVGGIAPNVLSGRLRALEQRRLVVATPYSQRPPRYVYELAESGRELADVLRLLSDWGSRQAGGGEGPRHAECGTPLQARWWCPTCERSAEPDDLGDVDYA